MMNSEREIISKLRESRVKEASVINPKLRSFTDAGYKGFSQKARLQPSDIEPQIAEFLYSYDDYMRLIVATDVDDRIYVRVLNKDKICQLYFNDEDLAINYANRLIRELKVKNNSSDAIDTCLSKGFRIVRED